MTAKNSTSVKEEIVLKTPDLYNVIIYNDGTTPFDFVIFVLTEVVELDQETAVQKTMQAHEAGKATVATLIKAKANEIVNMAKASANMNGFQDFTIEMKKNE